MVGELGQACPACKGPLELSENRESTLDGRGVRVLGAPMYALVCRTHGRHTEWYQERAAALQAPVLPVVTKHAEPLSGLPPDPIQREVPIQPKSRIPGQEPSGKEIVEAAQDEAEARARSKLRK